MPGSLAHVFHTCRFVDQVGAAVATGGVDGHIAAGAGVSSHAQRVAADPTGATWAR